MSISGTSSDLSPAAGATTSAVATLRAMAKVALYPLVGFWMFSGGFVLVEPSPYELVFLMVVPVALLAGFGLHRQPQMLLYQLILFTPFAMIGAFQVTHMSVVKGMIYVAVTMFLWLTAYFVANFVADAPRRHMDLMMRNYTRIAVLVSLIGSLAYLGLIPGEAIFTKFGRAKATFEDPNVFGPFLILPAMFALQSLLLGDNGRFWRPVMVFGILAMGVFFSFSRAAWGHLLFSAILVFVFDFIFEADRRARSRMIALAIAGVVVGIVGLAVALSIDDVRDLFLERASLVQNYDSGETGRFGRQAYAFELALSNPWGIGPLEFENLRITEEPHNTYVKVLLTYGWVGGLAYFMLVASTLKRGFGALVKPSPLRRLLIPLMAVFAALVLESAIIDSDHWRHYFLVVGMIWGVVAAYGPTRKAKKPITN